MADPVPAAPQFRTMTEPSPSGAGPSTLEGPTAPAAFVLIVSEMESLLSLTITDDICALQDQGKSVDATVMDLCEACGSGSIDLTEGTFQQLTLLDAGRIQVTWDFI